MELCAEAATNAQADRRTSLRARRCGARTKSGKPCRSPATTKGRCRLHGGASGSGGPPGKRNGQYRHGERTKAAIAERHCDALSWLALPKQLFV
jgi:hypothetical protein